MQVQDFDYELPEALIAQASRPVCRGGSRLLALGRGASTPQDLSFEDLPGQLREHDLLVVNDTRVVKARLVGRKASGGRVEVLVERPLGGQLFLAHVRASRAPRLGTRLEFTDRVGVRVVDRDDDLFRLELDEGMSLDELMARHGSLPLPPYIQRQADAGDETRYQTVFAARDGAVAAPTAGLHFDDVMLTRLTARGVNLAHITLHVGAGTFSPMRVEQVEDHVMHAERVIVSAGLVDAVSRARAAGGRVVAVGTTCVRALESAAGDGQLGPLEGDTRLFIRPGFRFRVVDALITNFHLPRSTLLMLVCAFAGQVRVLAAYRHAVAEGYRFFSYGDAMFLERETP